MKPASFMEAYPKGWLSLGVGDRANRLWTLNKKDLGKRADLSREFLWNFTACYKKFDMDTLEQLCWDLREYPDKNELWTNGEKEFLKDAVFSAYAVNKDDCGEILDDYTGLLYPVLEIIADREDRGIMAEKMLNRYSPVIIETLIPRGNRRRDGNEDYYSGARESVIEMFSNLDDYASEVDRKVSALKSAGNSPGVWAYNRFIILN